MLDPCRFFLQTFCYSIENLSEILCLFSFLPAISSHLDPKENKGFKRSTIIVVKVV